MGPFRVPSDADGLVELPCDLLASNEQNTGRRNRVGLRVRRDIPYLFLLVSKVSDKIKQFRTIFCMRMQSNGRKDHLNA